MGLNFYLALFQDQWNSPTGSLDKDVIEPGFQDFT